MGQFFKKLQVKNVIENKILMSGHNRGIVSTGIAPTSVTKAINDAERVDGMDDRLGNLEEVIDNIEERLHSINND